MNWQSAKKYLLDEGADPAAVDSLFWPFTLSEKDPVRIEAEGAWKAFEAIALRKCKEYPLRNCRRRKVKLSFREIGLELHYDYKVSNNHIPLYGRLFVNKHPWTRKFFIVHRFAELKRALSGFELRQGKAEFSQRVVE